MQLTFHGAAREVTGSLYLLETDQSRILIDAGMFQGPRRLERLNIVPRGLDLQRIDAILLTHGHLDHCGRLPLLSRSGYRGPIYATQGTIEIASLILHDAAHIQEHDAERENRRRARAGMKPTKPLFDDRDVEKVIRQFVPVSYDEINNITDQIKATFVEAGHILGSASIKLRVRENGEKKNLVFSGDLGQYNVPLMRDPALIEEADIVLLESTYGDRDHRPMTETLSEFKEILHKAFRDGGKVLIPSFAVGRTQQILYYLALMANRDEIPALPVYLDSPMGISATTIYARHEEIMDEAAQVIIEDGEIKKGKFRFRTCQSLEESQMLNELPGPCVIIAGAGMCNAGRILHHFRHNLWKENTEVVMVGYQARGSLGRLLLDGADKVKIFRETIQVNATIHGVGGFSAHGGQTDLLRWLKPMASKKTRVILTHGESHQIDELSYAIEKKFEIKPFAPKLQESIKL